MDPTSYNPSDILVRFRQADVCHSHASPSAFDGHEYVGQFLDERRLLLRRQHQVPVTLSSRCQRGENPAADAKVRLAHMRTFFSALEAEGDPPEVFKVSWPGNDNVSRAAFAPAPVRILSLLRCLGL